MSDSAVLRHSTQECNNYSISTTDVSDAGEFIATAITDRSLFVSYSPDEDYYDEDYYNEERVLSKDELSPQVVIWDLMTDRVLAEFRESVDYDTDILTVKFSPDGKFLLSVSHRSRCYPNPCLLTIRETCNWQVVKEIEFEGEVKLVEFDNDFKLMTIAVVSFYRDKLCIEVIETDNFSLVKEIVMADINNELIDWGDSIHLKYNPTFNPRSSFLMFSFDSKYLIFMSNDCLHIWDTNDWRYRGIGYFQYVFKLVCCGPNLIALCAKERDREESGEDKLILLQLDNLKLIRMPVHGLEHFALEYPYIIKVDPKGGRLFVYGGYTRGCYYIPQPDHTKRLECDDLKKRKKLSVIDLSTMSIEKSFPTESMEWLSISEDKNLIIGYNRHCIKIIDINTYEEVYDHNFNEYFNFSNKDIYIKNDILMVPYEDCVETFRINLSTIQTHEEEANKYSQTKIDDRSSYYYEDLPGKYDYNSCGLIEEGGGFDEFGYDKEGYDQEGYDQWGRMEDD